LEIPQSLEIPHIETMCGLWTRPLADADPQNILDPQIFGKRKFRMRMTRILFFDENIIF